MKAIEAILALQKTQATYDKSIRALEEQLISRPSVVQDIDIQLTDLRMQRARVMTAIMKKRSALGVSERAQLSHLRQSKFLELRMNARALKQRIRDRLRQRKFELDRLERSYRQTVNSMNTHLSSCLATLLTVRLVCQSTNSAPMWSLL